MIEGKTKSGFSFSFDENRANDMRLIDAIADLQDGNRLKVSKVLSLLLGNEEKERLYKHVEEEDGRVPVDKVEEEIVEIFHAAGDTGKN